MFALFVSDRHRAQFCVQHELGIGLLTETIDTVPCCVFCYTISLCKGITLGQVKWSFGGAGGIRTHEWRFCRPLPWASWVPRRARQYIEKRWSMSVARAEYEDIMRPTKLNFTPLMWSR